MRIGELARRTGTTPKAIRLYEARGLLGPIARSGSYRQYGEEDVAVVALIRHAQTLGFRLAELDDLHALDTLAGWQRLASLIDTRRTAVQQELQRLQVLDTQLTALEAELLACSRHTVPASPSACALPDKHTP